MSLKNKIIDIIINAGLTPKEKSRTIHTTCPICGKDDKFSILKENGACICYRGSCSFGKRRFKEWIALTYGITENEADVMLYSSNAEYTRETEVLDDNDLETISDLSLKTEDDIDMILSELEPIQFPDFHMVPIIHKDAVEGARYLENRGISIDIATLYDIHYSVIHRRVYFPIKIMGSVYGYQGRHIDKVADVDRMRNNKGFRRDSLVMFANQLIGKDFAILAEGPVDAIKFNAVGGNVASMGKAISNKQLAIIKSYGIKKIYLALDDDAAIEMNSLSEHRDLIFYKIDVPESCKQRCAIVGKKADFGECTFDEAKKAFENAELFNQEKILIYVRDNV